MSVTAQRLSADQQSAVDRIRRFFRTDCHRGCQQLTLGGYAGTGKTSILTYLWPELREMGACVMAPTGKAANVLFRKGIDRVSTIHSLLYLFRGTVETYQGNEKPVFDDRGDDDWGGGFSPRILVCDESSMVNDDLHRDIMARRLPVLWVGDHGQLPPVGGDPGIMHDPDIRLEKIHRQAEGNPILELAAYVRQGGTVTRDFADGDRLRVGGILDDKRLVRYALDNGIDQVIVGVNGKTVDQYGSRHKLNRLFRESLGRKNDLDVGDRIICTFNSRRNGIFNGQIFRVDAIFGSTPTFYECELSAEMPDGWRTLPRTIKVQRASLNNPDYRSSDRLTDCCEFDLGYCITCHKSQGDSWRRVAVIDKAVHAFDMSRWRYTGFTRAAEHLSVVIR